MLHLRDRLSAAAPWSRLSASDPGLVRLLMAARGTLAVLLATVGALAAGHWLDANPAEFSPGIMLSLMAPFLMREPTRRQRQRTLVVLAVPAAAAAAAASLLHGQGLAGNAAFLALVFACFLLQTRIPRGLGLGLVAVVGMYVGLYLRLPPATLPVQLLSVVLAVPVTALACFVLVPMRPLAVLRHLVAAVQHRAATVLMTARQPGGSGFRPALARLNEAALATDDHLALIAPDARGPLRLRLVELELAVARLMGALEAGDPLPRPGGLLLHARRLRHRRWASRHHGEGGTGALDELARAAAALGRAATAAIPFEPVAPAPPPPPGPLAWRVAIRVTLAAGLAMAAGMALSPERWFWAVITTYVVFLGGRSRGDALLKGAQRLGGTVLGLVGGLLIATALAGHPALEAIGMLVAVFGMYYLFLLSYTLGIVCVTVLLGLLYSAMGSPLDSLLLLRLEETAIGTACALLVAVLVFPARTRDQVTRSGQAVLSGLAEVVGACRNVWSGAGGPAPLDAMRRLDRQVADLRLALLPLTVGRALLRQSAAERPVPALLDCVHWARVLAAACQRTAGQPCPADAIAQAERIEARLAQLATAGVSAAAMELEAGQARPVLTRLEQAVDLLAERLAVRAAEGFALER